MGQKFPLTSLHPELILLIASYLPLHCKPATLLSLVLTNRKLHDIVMAPGVLVQKRGAQKYRCRSGFPPEDTN